MRLVMVMPDVGEPKLAVRMAHLRRLTDDEQPLREFNNDLHPAGSSGA